MSSKRQKKTIEKMDFQTRIRKKQLTMRLSRGRVDGTDGTNIRNFFLFFILQEKPARN
jgi:hypothetical protein